MNSHVEMELLAYLDGELDRQKQAQIDAHLAQCPRCAAELEQLQTLRRELDGAFDAALGPIRLPAAADARIRDRLRARLRGRLHAHTEPRPLWRLWQRRGLFAQAMLAVLVIVYALAARQTISLPPPATTSHETLVLGQDRLPPGGQAVLRVLVRAAAETSGAIAPVKGAQVIVRIGRTPGLASIVYQGHTDASGAADVTFTVPDDLQGQASLVVETAAGESTDRIIHPITIARDYKLFLNSDKPAYRPGQTIHTRALTLDAIDLHPAANRAITFDIFGPDGARLDQRLVLGSDFGIAPFDFDLPPSAAHGPYRLRAAFGDTISERTVDVGAYQLPAFRVTVETARAFYGPGERVTGFVQADYFFGQPVADGQITMRGYIGEAERVLVDQIVGETGDWGRFEFAFDLPPHLDLSTSNESARLDVEIEAVDTAGQRVGIRHAIPIAAGHIIVNAIPENSLLKPGVENIIYILTSYPDGRPAETALTIAVGGAEHPLATGPYGLAEFTYTPTESPVQLDIRAHDALGAEGSGAFTFDFDRAAAALLLRAERAVYQVGDTLRAEALLGGMQASAAQTVYLDVIRARQTVATLSAPVEDGRAVFALDLDGTMIGSLELYAYHFGPDGDIVRASRTVMVNAPRQVAVAVTADQSEYRPGQTARLQLWTGQPAAIGISVVDESVYAIETQPPGFARAYFFLERELLKQRGQVPGLDLAGLLDKTEIQAAQDIAAQAALAGVSAPGFTLSARSVPDPQTDAAAQAAQAKQTTLSNALGVLLALLPLLLGVVVVLGFGPTGVLERALRRVAVGTLAIFAASPLLVLVVGGLMWLLWALFGTGAPAIVLLSVIVLLAWLAAHGWRQRDARIQLATGLLAAYLALGGMLIVLAARGAGPQGALLILITAAFLLAIAALATLGQGLVLEGWSRSGWAATALALLLIPLVIYLPFVPNLASDLTRTIGSPTLYSGPIGWLTGCGQPAATEEPPADQVEMPAEAEEIVEVTREVEVAVEVTVEVESPPEEPAEEPIPEPTQAPVEGTAQPEPTFPPTLAQTATPPPPPATPSPAPTLAPPTPAPVATPQPAPEEPFPLRQVFPETLYWDAEALTDENGYLALDLPLADNVTTWRMTALASTQDGELGVTAYDIVVFQDLFIDFDLPATIRQGERVTVTVTLYNYSTQSQAVWVDPTPDLWYDLVSPPPQTLNLPPNDVATTQFTIRPERLGTFALQVTTASERASDAVIREVTVEP